MGQVGQDLPERIAEGTPESTRPRDSLWNPSNRTRETVAVRTVLGVALLGVAVLGLGGPIFYVVANLSGADLHVRGGLTRMIVEVAVGTYALFWSYRLRTGTLRTAPAR